MRRPLHRVLVRNGNCTSVHIPNEILRALNLRRGANVAFTIVGNSFLVTPIDEATARMVRQDVDLFTSMQTGEVEK